VERFSVTTTKFQRRADEMSLDFGLGILYAVVCSKKGTCTIDRAAEAGKRWNSHTDRQSRAAPARPGTGR
jgi:hypothetical protein